MLLVPSATIAQTTASHVRLADSSAAAVVAYARTGGLGRLEWLSGFLRQREGPQSAAKLDAVADGITNDIIAASVRAPDFEGAVDQLKALWNLLQAGSESDKSGVPYRRAGQKMIDIHRLGSGTVRSQSLSYLLSVAGAHDPGLAYLRSVAESSTDRTAPLAVFALIDEATFGGFSHNPPHLRDAARSTLRAMFMAKSVTDRSANDALLRFAARSGW
jgi:hypothetical protein